MGLNYLVVAAHPDDETLGCGGSIAKWVELGHQVHCVFLADGETARFASSELLDEKNGIKKLIENRSKLAIQALNILGVTSSSFYNLPDNRLDQTPLLEVTKIIESEIEQFLPSVVVTHSGADLNIDHRKVHEAVVTATRPLSYDYISKTLFFENLSSTEWALSSAFPKFNPIYFEEISEQIDKKIKAMEVYESEMRIYPHPRSAQAIKSLAQTRGSNIGFLAAEAFEIGWQRNAHRVD
jgi:LmbE family N-acetylglucosaminyl deacetylase